MTKAGDETRSVDKIVEDALARGRLAWPGLDLSAEDFTSFVLGRCVTAGAIEVDPHEDLYLACACLAGIPAAHAALDRAVTEDLRRAIRRVSAEPDFVDDVAADVRLALLGGDGGKPSVLERYRGRGPLRSFVLVMAMRRAIDRKRRQKEIATAHDTFPDGGVDNPGIARVDGSELREAFLAAFRENLSTLPTRERTILRLHVVDGVSADSLARMYGVHRATATRWIVQAKQLVFDATREALRQRFNVSPDTFESFARDEALGLDAELSTFLRPPK